MPSRIVILLDANGSLKVLSNDKHVQVIVLDRNVDGGPELVTCEQEEAGVDTLLNGLPGFLPERVEAIFSEVAPQLKAMRLTGKLGYQPTVQLGHLCNNWFPD